jgi:two-component system chemotaxis response regulator CheY
MEDVLAPHILIVDADADTRALYAASCALEGWNVVEASDGRDALAKALGRPPMLVLAEIALPFLDGLALVEILRRDVATVDVPILVVTADPSQTAPARRAGADGVLVKPVPVEAIVDETRRLVSEGRRRGLTSKPHKRGTKTHSFARFATTAPSVPVPALICPLCSGPLTYKYSQIGGVSHRHPEQWDYYVCPISCGTFQYRHRTRKLHRVVDLAGV